MTRNLVTNLVLQPVAWGTIQFGTYSLIVGPSALRAPAEQTKVATILGIFPLLLILLLPPLFKTTEGVVVLFQIFAWAPN